MEADSVSLQSKDGIAVSLSRGAALGSEFVKAALKDDPAKSLISTSLTESSLEKVALFREKDVLIVSIHMIVVEHHRLYPMEQIAAPLNDYQIFSNNLRDEFYSNLVKGLSRDEVFNLLYAAQFLQIASLISLV